MKNRLLTILPILLMLCSFNVSATISLACGIVGEINTNGDLEVANVQGTSNSYLGLDTEQTVMFAWSTSGSAADQAIQNVELTYSDTYSPTYNNNNQSYMISSGHDQNPALSPPANPDDIPEILPLDSYDNTVVWDVPDYLEGDYIYITIRDLGNFANRHTVGCQISGSAKTGDLSMKVFDINFYPNPVINNLNIKAGEVTINSVRLYDLKGNNVGNYKFNQSYQETIDVSTLPSGTYVAIINEEEQVKIVKR